MKWRVALTTSAHNDFDNALRWSAEMFGPTQALVYEQRLQQLLQAATDGPYMPAVKTRLVRGAVFFALHMRDVGLSGRHMLLNQEVHGHQRRRVLRILHDRMDLNRAVLDLD